MATVRACPKCGSAMREIVWGYGTIADVADAGDVVIGGCVVDVDDGGRAAALQCPICDTRTDAEGVALEAPQPPPTAGHPFDVSFSSPPRERWEVTVPDREDRPQGEQGASGGEGPPFVDDDFGGTAAADGWRDRVEPYASRDDQLPAGSAPSPERVEPYASRDDRLPSGSPVHPDRVPPYASPDGVVPQATGAWQERIEPYAGGPGEEAVAPDGEAAALGEQLDARWSSTSDFTDAEEEGWPPGSRDDD